MVTTSVVVALVVPQIHHHCQKHRYPRDGCHWRRNGFSWVRGSSYTASDDVAVVGSERAQELASWTVKELRQYIVDSNLNKRGWTAKLKTKNDYVSYILEEEGLEGRQQQHQQQPQQQRPDPEFLEEKMDRAPDRASIDVFAPHRRKVMSLEDAGQDFIGPEEVMERFPLLRTHRNSADTNSSEARTYEDVRQVHHPMFQGVNVASSTDLDIIFLGTASCIPTVTRGVSSLALRLNRSRRVNVNGGDDMTDRTGTKGSCVWLFDCGESTQLQIQQTTSVRPTKVTKIFLTHAHGDHTFGLPGLLCFMGQDRERVRDEPLVEIYGPQGLRAWLRVAIRYSVSRVVPPYRVHELMDVPMAPEWDAIVSRSGRRVAGGRYVYNPRKAASRRGEPWGFRGLADDPISWVSQSSAVEDVLEPSKAYGEMPGGRDIYPAYGHPLSSDGAPVWEVEDDGDCRVYAAPMSHTVPCVGYVVQEEDKPGRLRSDLVEPIVVRNLKALREAGLKIPMKIMAHIKDLPEGGSFTFPDGTVVHQSEVVEETRKGRKIVICGDTADARSLEVLAQGATLVVHEATNTFLRGIDRGDDLESCIRDAKFHGHSTPHMAGDFCRRVGAKRLIMNHFSARYKGDASPESISIMTRVEQQALAASGLPENCVVAAWDRMIVPVPSEEPKEESERRNKDGL